MKTTAGNATIRRLLAQLGTLVVLLNTVIAHASGVECVEDSDRSFGNGAYVECSIDIQVPKGRSVRIWTNAYWMDKQTIATGKLQHDDQLTEGFLGLSYSNCGGASWVARNRTASDMTYKLSVSTSGNKSELPNKAMRRDAGRYTARVAAYMELEPAANNTPSSSPSGCTTRR